MSVMLVKADRLAEAPLSFQEYVHDYFVEDVVFGIPVWRARREIHTERPGQHWKQGSGLAPSHSVDLMVYERKWEEPNITTWLHSDEARQSGIFHEFY
jgi:hypothetical protein